jgi:hypothetical protein
MQTSISKDEFIVIRCILSLSSQSTVGIIAQSSQKICPCAFNRLGLTFRKVSEEKQRLRVTAPAVANLAKVSFPRHCTANNAVATFARLLITQA